MNSKVLIAVVGALAWGLLARPGLRAEEPQGPTLVVVQTGIEVDPGGRVVGVEIDPGTRLPDVLRERTEQAIQAWRFKPIVQDGEPVGGKTWADVQICLAPSQDGRLDVAISSGLNGPGNVSGQWFPRLPLDLMRNAQVGVEYESLVRYRVQPDGRAELLEAKLLDPELEDRYGRGWPRELRRELARMRFKPEVIDGRAVATLMELPMTTVRHASSKTRAGVEADARKWQAETPVCQAAAGKPANKAMAVDSRFELLPPG